MTDEPKRRDDFTSAIDFGDTPFVDLGWHVSQVGVLPVVHVKGDTIQTVGTCFSVTNDGLCVTARHVIEDAVGSFEPSADLIQLGEQEHGWIGALYVSDEEHPEGPEHIYGGIMPMHRVYYSDGLDIALMKLDLPIDTRTGRTIFFPAHRLRMDFPMAGEPFFAMGYRKGKWSAGDALHHHSLDQRYSATRGEVEEIHPAGRDRVFLPFPCFRTSARFDGGMSGGPLMDHSGRVFGVICSSFATDDADSPISYASPVGAALAIHIEMRDPDGSDRRGFMWDLVPGKALDVEAGASRVGRTGDKISISFGCGLIMDNDLNT